jgi:RNA-directed DNA polymerase
MEITSKSEWDTWEEIDWKKVITQVFKLQKRIYRASRENEWKLVHKLQKMMVSSWYAKLISVRRISQQRKEMDSQKILES